MSPHALLVHYGYLGIILALILEFLLIPFPAETILILSGILWRQGVLHLLPLLVFATVGSFVGSLCAYYIGFYVGRPVLLRYGRCVRLDEAKLDKAERAFEKYALPIVGLGRFIAGIRVLIAYVAGINKMSTSWKNAATWLCSALRSRSARPSSVPVSLIPCSMFATVASSRIARRSR